MLIEDRIGLGKRQQTELGIPGGNLFGEPEHAIVARNEQNGAAAQVADQ